MSTNVYVSSVAYDALAQWAASTAYTIGQYVRQLASPGWGNERVFKVTTAGTSGATEPTWNKANNATTVDGTVTWTQVGGQETEQAAGNWKAPLRSVATATTLITAGNGVQVYVSSDHSETDAAAMTIGAGNCNFVASCSRTGASLPPTGADYTPGAHVSTTGASGITLSSGVFSGITFTAGNGTGVANIQLGSGNNHALYCEDCTFTFGATGSGTFGFCTTTSFPGASRFKNCNINFSGTGQAINLNTGCAVEWAGGTFGGTASPTNLFGFPSNTPPRFALFHGIDMSACASTLVWNGAGPWGSLEIWDCKLSPSIIMPTKYPTDNMSFFRMTNCDDGTSGKNYRFYFLSPNAIEQSNTQAVLTGGASDGDIAFSRLIVPNDVNSNFTMAGVIRTSWVSRRYNTIGTTKTLTLKFLAFPFAGYTLNNDDVWLEVEVLDTTGVPLGHLISTKGSILGGGSALATSTGDAWDSAAPARANSTAYAAFSVIKVASNSGRVFQNYTGAAGTSAASEPAGFASCVDGGTVVDGGNTWKCGSRLMIQQSITPRVKGIIRARLCMTYSGGSNQNFNLFYDPKLTIA